MPNLRYTVAGFTLTLLAALLVGIASPANAAGNYKCDTNSPQWDVTICVRTNASKQTDGTGYRMSTVRVWATGDPSTLESCPSFSGIVYLNRSNGETIQTFTTSACEFMDYSDLVDFHNVKFPGDAYVVVKVQMYDNGDPDPDLAKITLPAVD